MKVRLMFPLSLFVASVASMISAVVYGATYYVAKTGNNNYSCSQAQSAAMPKVTIASGLACMKAGDTLIINPGTYAESIYNTIPSGTSTSSRTKIIGNNQAKWTIRPNSCTNAVILFDNDSFVEIADFIIDAGAANCGNGIKLNEASTDNYIHHGEIKNTGKNPDNGQGITFDSGASPLTARNHIAHVWVHDSGTDRLDHCFYVTGSDNLLEYVTGNNCSGHGVHIFTKTDNTNNRNIVRFSHFYSNGSYGIGVYAGDHNKIHDNMLVNNGTQISGTGGIRLAGDKSVVYNNTIKDGGICIKVEPSADGSVIHNNVCVNNTNNMVMDLGTNTVQSNDSTTATGQIPGAPVSLQVAP
jgi:hypothetical protein